MSIWTWKDQQSIDGYWVPSLHNYSLDPRAAIVLDLMPRARAHQANETNISNFLKKFQARTACVWIWIDEIQPKAQIWKKMSDGFWKISFQTRVMAIWKWIRKKCDKGLNFGTNLIVTLGPQRLNWPEFFSYGKWQDHFQALVMGTEIVLKVHF